MNSILFLLLACSDAQKEQPSTKENAAKESPKAKEKGFAELDLNSLEEATKKVELIPSPLKMQKEIEKAGISKDLGTFIPSKTMSTDVEDREQLAIRCGILLTDITLSVKRAESATMLSQLSELKKGMATLKTGSDIQTVIDELINTVKQPNFDRDAMLAELDDLASVLIPELKHESEDWIVPLIQAGTWLEGIHLISSAVVAKGDVTNFDFLKQPGAARYFIRYIDREGRTQAPPVVIQKVKGTLETLEKIASKESISAEDLQTVQKETKALLSFI